MAQFSAVGIHQQTILNEQSEPTDPPILIKESSNHYKFYCSGRRHCIGMLIELEVSINIFIPRCILNSFIKIHSYGHSWFLVRIFFL